MKAVNAKERERFIKFAVVGTIGATIDFGVFNLLIGVFGVPSVWANVASFTVAVVSNFIWNRYWTYPDSRSKNIRRQLAEFFAVNIVGVMIRTPIFVFLETPWRNQLAKLSLPFSINTETVGSNFALGTAMVVILFWNYFVNRYWTYSDVKSE